MNDLQLVLFLINRYDNKIQEMVKTCCVVFVEFHVNPINTEKDCLKT